MRKIKPTATVKTPEPFTLGLDGYARIAAVEGLHLTAAMRQQFREFDRLGLSDDERRREITARYGKTYG